MLAVGSRPADTGAELVLPLGEIYEGVKVPGQT